MSQDRRRPRLFKVYDFAPEGGAEESGPSLSDLELARLFGRQKPNGDASVPTDIGCSECTGVLYVSPVGERGWLSFRCRVGHAFSADSLLAAKEEQLEDSLWASIETLEELIQLYGVLGVREQGKPDSPRRAALAQRLALAQIHLRRLRDLIETDGPAPLSAGPPEGG